MMHVYLLGTGASLNLTGRLTTALAVLVDNDLTLVDCGSNVVAALIRARLDPTGVSRLILTHEHPDHTAGFPLLAQQLWLAGRQAPLPVYGPPPAIDVGARLLAQYTTSSWQGLFEIRYHAVHPRGPAELAQTTWGRILTAPARHSVPTLALRFEANGGPSVVYSADTAPSDELVHLAGGADLLIHEATGPYPGVHTDGGEAGRIARDAGVRHLVLVHLPGDEATVRRLVADAQAAFGPNVVAGQDGMILRPDVGQVMG
ncbi:MAG: MBL fold metallo-hydrolase [Ardenticatenia bacterium]|nr:MBL fold metallo-hydrolase [Ardenticatenia bacterium]